jgi:PIN domain nuclease of toxin-antitoxin system
VKLLLDTHIWLWSHLAPEKLSRRVARALENPSSELWLSPISIWELVTLSANRKVVLDEEVGAWVRRAMEAAPMQEAPISHDIALAVGDVALPHRDPADRFLVATARVLDLTLVTGDRRILDHARHIALLGN